MIKARFAGLAVIVLAVLLAPVQALADWRRAVSPLRLSASPPRHLPSGASLAWEDQSPF